MSFTDPQSPASPPSLSRRTVAHGLAWTVPAVAAAAAAPAFAVSCANPAAFTGRFTQANVYGTPPSTYTWSAAGRTPITLSLNTVADSGKSLTPNNLTSAGGINQGYNCIGADPQVAYVLPLGLAIGKYVHNFLQCGLQQGYAFAANRLAQQRSLLRTTVPNAVRLSVPLASAAAERAGF